MRKKKGGLISLLLIFVLIFTIALSGCSSSKESSGKTSSNQKPVTIKIGYFSGGASDKVMQKLIKQFSDSHPNIKTETETAPYGQFFQKLDTEVATGNAPDVWLSDGVYVMKYASRGAAKDLTSLINNNLNKSDYYGLDFNKDSSGKYWAVPQGIQIGVLFYNKDLFDKAHVAYPNENWTWDDLKKASEKLTLDSQGRNANDPNFDSQHIKQFGFKFNGITEGWFPIMKAFGGGPLDSTMQKSIIDSPENTQALQYIVDGTKRHIFTSPSDIKSFKNSMAVFPSQSAAMRIGIFTRTLDSNQAGINYDVTVLPKGPTGKRFSPVIANSWMIYSKTSSAKQKAAWEWIKYWVTNDSVQTSWAKLGEAVPVKKSVANSDSFLNASTKPDNKKAFLDSFKFAGTLDANAVWEEWLTAFQNNMDPAFNGKEDVSKAQANADKAVQKVLDNFYKK